MVSYLLRAQTNLKHWILVDKLSVRANSTTLCNSMKVKVSFKTTFLIENRHFTRISLRILSRWGSVAIMIEGIKQNFYAICATQPRETSARQLSALTRTEFIIRVDFARVATKKFTTSFWQIQMQEQMTFKGSLTKKMKTI